MRRISIPLAALVFFAFFNACSKSTTNNNNNNDSTAKTVQNISGSYNLTALTFNFGGLSIDYYDSLDACERDNVIQLKTDLTAAFIDAGIQCSPPEDSSGVWSLSANADSIYIGSSSDKTGFLIKSWDGKTLVLTGKESQGGFTVSTNSTLVKK